MALEYELTLAGSPPVAQVAERALPDVADRPTGTARLLTRDLYERYGFHVSVSAGADGYVSAESDDGLWEWEPATYVSVTFNLNKVADRKPAVENMLTVVRRVLDSGTEDAALVLNGDVLLLTRLDGVLREHHRDTWWAHYPG
jgi:hypothetical protein